MSWRCSAPGTRDALGATLKLFLPAPELVWREMGVLLASGQLWSSLYVTLTSIAKAYAIAVVAGIAVGFVVARSRTLVQMFEPVLSGMFAVPLTMFFPLFVLFFGIGPDSKVAYGATYAFFPIALNTIAAFSNVDELYLRARAPWARPAGSSSAMSTCRRRCRSRSPGCASASSSASPRCWAARRSPPPPASAAPPRSRPS